MIYKMCCAFCKEPNPHSAVMTSRTSRLTLRLCSRRRLWRFESTLPHACSTQVDRPRWSDDLEMIAQCPIGGSILLTHRQTLPGQVGANTLSLSLAPTLLSQHRRYHPHYPHHYFICSPTHPTTTTSNKQPHYTAVPSQLVVPTFPSLSPYFISFLSSFTTSLSLSAVLSIALLIILLPLSSCWSYALRRLVSI